MVSAEIVTALDRFGFYFFQCLTSFLWQSSLILGPVLISLWVFRRSSPAMRNSIILTGFMSVVVILAYSWFLGMPRVPSHPLPVMPDYRASDRLILLDGSKGGPFGAFRLREGNFGESSKRAGSEGSAVRNGTARGGERDARPPLRLRDIFSYPWALGLAFYLLIQGCLVLKLCMEMGIVRWWICRSRNVEEFTLSRVFWRAAFFLEVKTSQFGIMECSSLSIPVTVGAVYPRVIIPAGFQERCTPEDFRAVVYHEMAHVRRRDPLVLTCISFLRTVLFFHPLVQLAAKEYTLIAEQASDETAIQESGVTPVSYARSLTRVVELLSPQARKPSLALGIFRQRSLFFHRLELILSDSSRKYRRLRPLFSTVAVVGLALFLTVSVSLPLVERNPGSVETTALRDSVVPPVLSLASPSAACAIPVRNIRIDGELDDWPKEVVRYSIRNRVALDGSGGDGHAAQGKAPVSFPRMMIGYGPEDGLLYVAVTVTDERVAMVNDPEWAAPGLTDACEIYVDGMHVSRAADESRGACGAWDLPAQLYVMCPWGGAYDRGAWLQDPPYTPALFRGNIRKTGSLCAFTRQGNITTYEWAVRVYTRYPEQPVRLAAGGIIGFDVVVRDRDPSRSASSCFSFGPPNPFKSFDTSLLGDLVLVERYEDLGFVSGAIARCREPYAGRTLRIYRGHDWMGEYLTDRAGRFHLMLPPGDYTVRPEETYGEERLYLDSFTVPSGSLVKPRLHVAMNGFSRLRYETEAFTRMLSNSDGHGTGKLSAGAP